MGMAERGLLPRAFAKKSRYGTPTLAILVGSCFCIFLATFEFGELIEMVNFLYVFAQVIEVSAGELQSDELIKHILVGQNHFNVISTRFIRDSLPPSSNYASVRAMCAGPSRYRSEQKAASSCSSCPSSSC